jgi:branched-chain amino acid aminotransferase
MQTFSIDGQLCPKEMAKIPVMDHGLLYGDGVFEGLRFYRGKLFELQAHITRLFDSARAISLAISMSKDDILAALCDAVKHSGLDNGYVRLLITRGDGALGIDPDSCSGARVIIIVDQLKMVSEEVLAKGATLIIASTRKLRADQIDPRIKSLNYLNHILARLEANAAGADEAVMLNDQGRIAEGTADNIFIVRDSVLCTPPLFEGSLAGVTRSVVLRGARQAGINLLETPMAPYDLYTADEVFLSGTGAELIPVREVSGRHMPIIRGPVYCQVEAAFRDFVQGKLATG